MDDVIGRAGHLEDLLLVLSQHTCEEAEIGHRALRIDITGQRDWLTGVTALERCDILVARLEGIGDSVQPVGALGVA